MRSRLRRLLPLFITAVLTIPIFPTTHAAQQPTQPPPQAFEPFVNRLREGLKLNDAQVGETRNVLLNHGPKLIELRRRAQANPYGPALQAEAEKEQKVIREEIALLLDEDQKGKLASIDFRPLVPLGLPFAVVSIVPRARIDAGTLKLASSERLISVPTASSKGRSRG